MSGLRPVRRGKDLEWIGRQALEPHLEKLEMISQKEVDSLLEQTSPWAFRAKQGVFVNGPPARPQIRTLVARCPLSFPPIPS